MKIRRCVFNGFLVFMAAVLACGCATSEERKLKKQLSTLRIHVEADAGSTDRSSAISVHRASPILLNIDREMVLDERDVETALVVDQPGGLFAVEINFNRHGGRILERTTVVNKGRRLAIFSDFGEQARWIAAPLITARNTSGRLVFTPDATREEAQRFVRGLNNMVRKLERKENWPFPAPLDR
jgi:preprotein translocase subunit SecD